MYMRSNQNLDEKSHKGAKIEAVEHLQIFSSNCGTALRPIRL